MSKARVEAFSDGVLAVAITLLALDLRVPDSAAGGSLAYRLAEQWPSYSAYVVSFLTIGVIWINHHALLQRLTGVDHGVLVLNLLLLMTVVVLPFTTALMAAYLRAPHGARVAAAAYGASYLMMSFAFLVMQWYVLVRKPHLLHERVTTQRRRSVLRRNAAGVVPYALATAGAALSPYITLGVSGALALFYALPSTTGDIREFDGD